MAVNGESRAEVPGFVGILSGLLRRLLTAGVPMGPSALISVRGRKSGIERTTPVMLIEVGGRRWIQGTFGESNWVRNLRASGHATLRVRGRAVNVKAVELSTEDGFGGPPLVLLEQIRRALGPRAATVALHTGGGVRDLADVSALARCGVASVVMGRALAARRFTLAEAKAAAA